MTTINNSISQFLLTGEFQYRIYDLGRKLTLLPNALFEAIEEQKERYPYPFQQKAWLALLFWSEEDKTEPTIWFLQFPIDELGYLKQASRDAFLQELLIHIGNNLQAQQSGQPMQDSLKESAFAFKPRQDRLAIFHAFATVELNQAPSQYYLATQDYLQGKNGYQQWQFLGLQGIADLIARLEQDNNNALLCQALPNLPDTPLTSFAENLEHHEINDELSHTLQQCLHNKLAEKKPNPQVIAALMRALSSSKNKTMRQAIIKQLLESDKATEIEVIAAIASRSWQDITQKELLPLFLQTLATQPQQAFNAILIDIIAIPNMRQPILNALRNPKRPPLLSQRIGGFLGNFANQETRH